MKKAPENKQAEEPLNQEKEAPMRRGPDPEPFNPGMGGGHSGEEVPAEPGKRGRDVQEPEEPVPEAQP